MERWVPTCRHELLDRTLIWNQQHLLRTKLSQVGLRGSYSRYYRRMLAPLLAALEFGCNNSAYRPVMDAIDLFARYAGAGSDQKLYAAGEKVPVDRVVPRTASPHATRSVSRDASRRPPARSSGHRRPWSSPWRLGKGSVPVACYSS